VSCGSTLTALVMRRGCVYMGSWNRPIEKLKRVLR
jgi:hypothetical protein